MRFYAFLTIVSVLALVLAAPHPQSDRRGVPGQILPASPHESLENYSPVSLSTSTFNSHAEADGKEDELPVKSPTIRVPSGALILKATAIGKSALGRSHDEPAAYVDYPLSEYKGKADDNLVLRIVLEANSPSDVGFKKLVEAAKVAGRLVDSGAAFFSGKTLTKLSRPVIILRKSQKSKLKL
ncbi:uncharacterized protein C8R40DRAFT_1172359 [Lentinula edodes]|uniref:uncharacterized protein n=1 Tax=Lentinula edodes TaxID=5353 RepID=UPI001E8CCCF0|nr:uncharacterized protein C8R40DRAFT_1172359 [Lentinula edodes]KAH7873570.1 hypothetical protein C8R40DRAFT_1172359 [Lentinula edodes]